MKNIWMIFCRDCPGCRMQDRPERGTGGTGGRGHGAGRSRSGARSSPPRQQLGPRGQPGDRAKPQRQSASDDPTLFLPDLEGSLESDGYGLDTVLDGSSIEAFRQSLEMVALDSTPEQYRQLESALKSLRYLNLAFQDLNVLYSHLDGMTGHEVIDYVSVEAEKLR